LFQSRLPLSGGDRSQYNTLSIRKMEQNRVTPKIIPPPPKQACRTGSNYPEINISYPFSNYNLNQKKPFKKRAAAA
jgi:hypothetical protein